MLDTIKEFIVSIGNGISMAIDFLLDFFKSIADLVVWTGKALAQIPKLFSWLPSDMLAVLLVIFAVVVAYKVMGREG